MRNLKKILALVLALVMSMSLLATANAFSDDKDIDATYNEAVSVLSGLKVFEGYEDGSFKPKGSITRAEVAAIIYRIVTGDVEDKQVKLYADYNKFTDVKSSSWYAGYVNYCANAELVKGRDGKTFDPQGKVTGYEALAMILRAVGYDKNGEFTGASWQVQTAAVAKSLGITNNIIPGTLGTAASRETVAEILFRAILVPTVEYTPAFGYKPTETTLGWKAFKLETIQGVVVANQYADLYSGAALAEGKTELETADGTRALNYATAVTDLGEARYAYVSGKTVYAMADAGNTTWENAGAAANIKGGKFASVTGLSRGDAEEFINFARNDEDLYETDIRINYSVTGSTDEKDVTKIPAGAKLTQTQYDEIKAIFANDDKDTGWVVVGTKYNADTALENDISDDMTFKKFVKEYLTAEKGNTVEINIADNGEWLKAIDNNGDGVAEYVFRVDFTMTTVVDVNTKKETYVFEDSNKTIDKADVVTEIEKIAEGDVVLYTYIDGIYYVSAPEIAVETIDKKGIDYKAETFTCGDTVYSFSGIEQVADDYYHDVSEADTQVSYDFYLDHFGYIRLYTESAMNRGFVLLLDGFFETDRRVDKYKAEIWNVEAEKSEDVVVLDGKAYPADTFIDNGVVGHDDEGTWERLNEFDEVYTAEKNTYFTNIAAFSVDEDGAYALNKVQDASNKRDYDTAEIDVAKMDSVKDRTLVNTAANELPVQTTTDTLYYYVLNPGTSKQTVTTWVGYSNAPKGVALGEDAVAYAVTTEASNGKYDVAQVVVIESNPAVTSSVNFVYALDQKLAQEKYVGVYGIGSLEEGYGLVEREGEITKQADGSMAPYQISDLIQFYTINSKGAIKLIDEDYNDYNIYAGLVTVAEDVDHRDYVQVSYGNTSETTDFYTQNTPTFAVTFDEDAAAKKDTIWVNGVRVEREGNVRKTYDVIECNDFSAGSNAREDMGDHVIFVTDKKGNVEYVINVTESVYGKDDAQVLALAELWQKIWNDQNTPDLTWIQKALALVDKNGENDYTLKAGVKVEDAQKLHDTAKKVAEDKMTAQGEAKDAAAAVAILKSALDKVDASNTELAQAKTDALAALAKRYDELSKSEALDAEKTYKDAQAAINAAKTAAEVDAALADGIAAVAKFDKNSDTTLAQDLVTAGVSMDEAVATLLKAEVSVNDIRESLSDAGKYAKDVIPALAANDVAVKDIFDGYKNGTFDDGYVATVAKNLKDADVDSEDIIEGYGAHAINAKGEVTGWTGLTFKYNAETNTLDLTIGEKVEVTTGSGIGSLLIALGDHVEWTAKCNDQAWDHTGTVAEFKVEITAILSKLSEGTWSIDAKIDGTNYTINFVESK